jgi:glucose-6-phosphate isomerase
MNQLDQLKQHTTVVADTGNFHQLAQFAPRDATTNPSLILKAVQQPDYAPLLAETVAAHRGAPLDASSTRCWCASGCEILKVVPGRVSTEVDARLSFDTAGHRGPRAPPDRLYEAAGIGRERVLIKIAATWEGIQAAAQLEREGIHCNLTLLFAFCQAVACGDAGVQLISPFVGRIYDWHKKAAGAAWDEAARRRQRPRRAVGERDLQPLQAPRHRHRGDGRELPQRRPDHRAGRLRPADHQPRAAGAAAGQRGAAAARAGRRRPPGRWTCRPCTYDEKAFRWALNEDAMATEKLAEGIRAFAADAGKLDRLIEHPGAVAMSDFPAATAPAPGPRCRATSRPTAATWTCARPLPATRAASRPSACRRPRSLPTCRRTCRHRHAPLPARPGARVRPRGPRDAMLAGEPINTTEGRAVLHTALRAPRGAGPFSDEVHGVLDAMLAYAERVRADGGFTDVVNIGIGGSDLGPAMVVPALDAFAHRGLRCTSSAMSTATTSCRCCAGWTRGARCSSSPARPSPRRRPWPTRGGARLVPGPGRQRHRRHFVATTTNVKAAAEFGITPPSASGTGWAGAIRCGAPSACRSPSPSAPTNFRALLAGAHAMDRHFADAPLAGQPAAAAGPAGRLVPQLPPLHQPQRGALPPGPARLPAYLQQLEMESNGKRVDLDGEPLPFGTSPVVWGEPGTNGQHAYFQMLHQGTDVIPVEFIAVKPGGAPACRPAHQAAGQLPGAEPGADAGQDRRVAATEKRAHRVGRLDRAVLARHRSFPGNRPSTTFVLDALTPRSLGALIALYEHRVFTSGALWGINSFDQWGVELGKALCNQLLPRWPAATWHGAGRLDRRAATGRASTPAPPGGRLPARRASRRRWVAAMRCFHSGVSV